MNIKKINEDIYMLSMSIERMLFESMWDTPKGVTLNSYIVKGDKTAIIDGFIGWDGVPETLYKGLNSIDIDPKSIDYIVLNHLEPDHTGWIKSFLSINKDFKIFVTQKGAELVQAFYGDLVAVEVIKAGDTLDLGQGKSLAFHPVPNVHWPETMMTYETQTKTLFSCDLYGAFGVMNDHIFDDQMTAAEQMMYEEEGMRYFSNVMTTFSNMVEKAISKTEQLEIKMIAPGHGPLYRKHPQTIIDAYKRYCQYAKGFGKKEVTLIWGSMYGMTKKVVDLVIKQIEAANVKVNVLALPEASPSDLVLNVFKAGAVLLACPTYEYKLFPPMAHAIDEIGRKRISGKQALRFGSYGWSGGAEKELTQLFDNYRLKWDFMDSVEFKGMAREDDVKAIKNQVDILIQNLSNRVIEA